MRFFISVLTAFCALTLSAQKVPSYFIENDYLDAKIKSVPKGSSFIFITDTHFPRSTRTSTPHGGGDHGVLRDLLEAVCWNDDSRLTSTVAVSVESHVMGFDAEKSRKNGRKMKVRV